MLAKENELIRKNEALERFLSEKVAELESRNAHVMKEMLEEKEDFHMIFLEEIEELESRHAHVMHTGKRLFNQIKNCCEPCKHKFEKIDEDGEL